MKFLCLLLAAASLAVAGVSAPAGPAGRVTVVGPQTPVRVEVVQPALPGRPFRFIVANSSTKDIAAMVVAIDFYDAHGQRESGPSQITSKALLPTDPGLAPAAVMNVAVTDTYVIGPPSKKVLPARAELYVDYVLFMDGTTWGANRSKSAGELRAIRTGAAMERNRLAATLKSQGPAALLAALGALGPPAKR